jgi:hypothetical protein
MSEIESVKYSSYTPAQKRASQLYRQNNKDKINAQRKRYYQKRKETDPNFLEYKRMKAKEYYEKKKLNKVVKPEAKPDVKPEEEIKVVDTKELLKILIPDSTIVKALEKVESENPDGLMPELLKEASTSPLPDEPKKKSKKSKKEKKQ